MNTEAFQHLVIQDLKQLKDHHLIIDERLNSTCKTLTEVKTIQTNFITQHEKKIENNTNKKFKILGFILGVPTALFQVLQYGGLI